MFHSAEAQIVFGVQNTAIEKCLLQTKGHEFPGCQKNPSHHKHT